MQLLLFAGSDTSANALAWALLLLTRHPTILADLLDELEGVLHGDAPTYVTHHLPELYPNPERFDPERWNAPEPPPYAYIPFGAGPHTCIGAQFAMMEIRIVLAMILQRFRLTPVRNARIDRRVQATLSTRHGMPMVAVPQDRQVHQSKVSLTGDIHEMVELVHAR